MPALSPRQQEIAGLIASGMQAKEIAHKLGISIRTVDVHRTLIYTKFGVRNAVELTLKFHGLPTEPTGTNDDKLSPEFVEAARRHVTGRWFCPRCLAWHSADCPFVDL